MDRSEPRTAERRMREEFERAVSNLAEVREVCEEQITFSKLHGPLPPLEGHGAEYKRFFLAGDLVGVVGYQRVERAWWYMVLAPRRGEYVLFTAKRNIANERACEEELRSVLAQNHEYLTGRSDIRGLHTSVLQDSGSYRVVFHWRVPGKIVRCLDDVLSDKVLELAEPFPTREAADAAAARVMDIALHGLRDQGYRTEAGG
jgi:hypothetical protein